MLTLFGVVHRSRTWKYIELAEEKKVPIELSCCSISLHEPEIVFFPEFTFTAVFCQYTRRWEWVKKCRKLNLYIFYFCETEMKRVVESARGSISMLNEVSVLDFSCHRLRCFIRQNCRWHNPTESEQQLSKLSNKRGISFRKKKMSLFFGEAENIFYFFLVEKSKEGWNLNIKTISEKMYICERQPNLICSRQRKQILRETALTRVRGWIVADFFFCFVFIIFLHLAHKTSSTVSRFVCIPFFSAVVLHSTIPPSRVSIWALKRQREEIQILHKSTSSNIHAFRAWWSFEVRNKTRSTFVSLLSCALAKNLIQKTEDPTMFIAQWHRRLITHACAPKNNSSIA